MIVFINRFCDTYQDQLNIAVEEISYCNCMVTYLLPIYQQTHEFETFLCQVRIVKSCGKQSSWKDGMILRLYVYLPKIGDFKCSIHSNNKADKTPMSVSVSNWLQVHPLLFRSILYSVNIFFEASSDANNSA